VKDSIGQEKREKSTAHQFWARIRRDKLSCLGALIIFVIVFLAFFGAWLTPHNAFLQDLGKRLQPPSFTYPFGTDGFGRCIFSRIIYGARYSLLVGLVSIGIGLSVGMLLGLLSGFYRGFVDALITRFIDILMAFPAIFLAIAVIVVLGPGLYNVMIAVGIWSIPMFTRLIRGSVLSICENDFIKAARALGAKDRTILISHILPNVAGTAIVLSTLRMATAILSAAGLSFLGLGAQPPLPEWGAMLNDGRAFFRITPHVVLFPGLAIMIVVLGFNLLGDGLRDILDPRLKE
jgi:peptide/nickel transport system permease protein